MSNREDREQLVHFWIPKELHRQMRIAAAEDALTMRLIVLDAISAWLQRRKAIDQRTSVESEP